MVKRQCLKFGGRSQQVIGQSFRHTPVEMREGDEEHIQVPQQHHQVAELVEHLDREAVIQTLSPTVIQGPAE